MERILLSRVRRRIPLVITVTGTRGKSSVARALGSVLREDGRRVLVKTTGTVAQFVMPDGSIEEVARRGSPTVLEQKNVLRKAVRIGAEVLVSEIMSIGPENHRIESQGILRPNIVVITSVRRDHTEAMGCTLEEIAETIMLDVAPDSQVFSSKDQFPLFHPPRDTTWHQIALPESEAFVGSPARAGSFTENEHLVAAVARSLAVPQTTIREGLRKAIPERGEFTIVKHSGTGKVVFLVNAFAANDPDSTSLLLDRSRAILGGGRRFYGIFALRQDRGARTLQWIQALRSEQWSPLREIFIVGDAPRAASRRIRRSSVLPGTDAALVTAQAISRMEDGAVLFGFGNTHGIGLALLDHWMKEGTIYGT